MGPGNSVRRLSYIRTYTGKLFYPFKPSPKDVDVRDIAHGLSNLCRFSGQCAIFWSVAQHAMLAADLSLDLSHADPRIVQLLRTYAVLHHDDSEAYCIDLPKPIKNYIPAYEKMEDGVTKAINEALNVKEQKEFVKTVDNQAFNVESSLLFDRNKLRQELALEGSTFARLAKLTTQEAEKMFLDYSDMLSYEIHEEKFKPYQHYEYGTNKKIPAGKSNEKVFDIKVINKFATQSQDYFLYSAQENLLRDIVKT